MKPFQCCGPSWSDPRGCVSQFFRNGLLFVVALCVGRFAFVSFNVLDCFLRYGLSFLSLLGEFRRAIFSLLDLYALVCGVSGLSWGLLSD